MKTTFFAAVLFFVATGASAQAIYTKVGIEGHLTFSDRPVADVLPDGEPAADAAPEETEKTQARRPYVSPRLAAAVNANEAERRLRQAQLKRKQGMAPLPGEQTKGQHGGALNERYWRRQEKLRLLVERAQHRLNATRPPQFAAAKKPALRLAASRPEEIPEDQAQQRQ